MKISIGSKIQQGPWGGGNQFAINLAEYLTSHNHQVCFNLSDPDIDLILLTEPRTHLRISAYGSNEILRYLFFRNPSALVVHRINECDERKGIQGTNRLILSANRIVDHTVFVSSWLKHLYIDQGFGNRPNHVILNGANPKIFHSQGHTNWNGIGPLKLVTHHWGNNWLKGFDIYQQLDQLIAMPKYKEKLALTYIGQLPEGFQFSNSIYQSSLFGETLANCLRQKHVYITASRNEPGSNHQNEGACCGLPLLYIESGSLPEYCDGYGISYQPENFQIKLDEMIDQYDHWTPHLAKFPHTSTHMCENYELLFQQLLDQRDNIVANRTWKNQPVFLLGAFFPRTFFPSFLRKVNQGLKRWIG